MARKVRIQYPGTVDHLMNRGELPRSGIGERVQTGSKGPLAVPLATGPEGAGRLHRMANAR